MREDMYEFTPEDLREFLDSMPDIMPLGQYREMLDSSLTNEDKIKYEKHEIIWNDAFQDVDFTPSDIHGAVEDVDSDIYSDVAYNQSEVDDTYLNNRFEVQVLVKNENQAEIIPIVYDREVQDFITFNQLVESVESKLDKECTVEVDAGGRWDSNFECLFPETDEVTLECSYDNLDNSFRNQFESIAEDFAKEVKDHQKDGEVQER